MGEIRNLLPFVRRYLPLLGLAFVLLTISGGLEALIVMLLEPIFDLWSKAGGAESGTPKFQFLQTTLGLQGPNALLKVAFLLVGFSLLKGVFLFFAEYFMAFAGQNVVARLRKTLYARLLDHSLAFYGRHRTGELMARVVSDTEELQQAVSEQLTNYLRQFVLLVSFLALVLYIDWKLSLLAFLLAPFVWFVTTQFGKRIRSLTLRVRERISDLSNALQETITGQTIVKAFGMETYERSRFDFLADRQVKLNLRRTRLTAASSPIMEFMGYLLFVPFLFYANTQISQGASVGAFVSFVVALFKLYEPIRKLTRMHLFYQQAFACSERIFKLLGEPIEIEDSPDAVVLPPFGSDISFEGVCFRYESNQEMPVLSDINLTIRKGEIVAVVGRSGAGKTTLVSLIPRFYDVSGGRITIDGLDVRDVTQASLRGQIAMVTQDTFLFNDTVRNNIAYGQRQTGLEAIEEAARAAYIHRVIEKMPRGYQTVIGERGQRLSGGQRQRLAIARAILKKAPILILDEATSSLDSASERLVQKALNNLMRHCTTVVIAHRLSTVRMANRIVVMEASRIVESGTHESLMAKSGVYRKLYELQFEDAVVV